MTQTSAERREQWRKTLAESEGWAYSDLEPHDYQQQAAAGEALSDKESTEVLRVSDAATNTILKARDTEIERLRAMVASSDEAARMCLRQRQEMAEERFIWQERGDRAEAERDEAREQCTEMGRQHRFAQDEARGRVKRAEAGLEQARATILAEAITAVEDPEQRRAASGRDTLGWESARDVLVRMAAAGSGGQADTATEGTTS